MNSLVIDSASQFKSLSSLTELGQTPKSQNSAKNRLPIAEILQNGNFDFRNPQHQMLILDVLGNKTKSPEEQELIVHILKRQQQFKERPQLFQNPEVKKVICSEIQLSVVNKRQPIFQYRNICTRPFAHTEI